MIELGTTFWGGNPDDPSGKHLWFVISDPNRNSGFALIVNMTTFREGSENCCVLQQGEHPGVDCKSAINYLRARNVLGENIEKAYRKRPNHIVFAERADMDLIIKILQGALESKRISPECRDIAKRELKLAQSGNVED